MRYQVNYYINDKFINNGIQYWLPRIGEKVNMSNHELIVKDIIYNIPNGSYSELSITIMLDFT